jgi:hypothetical protein
MIRSRGRVRRAERPSFIVMEQALLVERRGWRAAVLERSRRAKELDTRWR